MAKTTRYYPVVLFRAKCFAKTPFHVISGKHYVASWANRLYKTTQGATDFARKQIYLDDAVWQLAGAKKVVTGGKG